ncbi:hypothetical protein ECA2505 [Pectobacterium atrosepticum SCRI1043]|uniref:Uncharacterized protein n=1 Tax=Pectobacterium atrosepticum (strain SCRI 1043 / ATCC BAA-672) TaxID=218491 RepID=Q6D488_PECAS|nr:hypothetical protein ECA2505 [Pectobacterium atrosepticum SCRI1043]
MIGLANTFTGYYIYSIQYSLQCLLTSHLPLRVIGAYCKVCLVKEKSYHIQDSEVF